MSILSTRYPMCSGCVQPSKLRLRQHAVVAEFLLQADLGRVVAGDRHRLDRGEEVDARRALLGLPAAAESRVRSSVCCAGVADTKSLP